MRTCVRGFDRALAIIQDGGKRSVIHSARQGNARFLKDMESKPRCPTSQIEVKCSTANPTIIQVKPRAGGASFESQGNGSSAP